MRADVIVDLQYGSTGKGKIAALLARRRQYAAAVRVQSIQAGHTIFYKGKAYKMRTIPCAWVNPDTILVLGPGQFIDKQLLLDEIKMVSEATGKDVRDRLFVDYRTTYIIDEDYQSEEKNELKAKIGSTSEGAGSSLIRKIWRKSTPTRVENDKWAEQNGINVIDTVGMINEFSGRVMIEGSQGTLLSVHTTPFYPYCTSRECTAAGIISEAGISPLDVEEIHGVFRTYPIRVGGNSGPTWGNELSWNEVAKRSGNPKLVPEITTVTNRQRRIFEFSDREMNHSILLNKPTHYHLGFINYINNADYGKTELYQLSEESAEFIERLERKFSISINTIGTGALPDEIIITDL